MRTTVNSHIWDTWNSGGPFVGDGTAAHGRVTVEIGWQLTESGQSTIGSFTHGPIRWFQRSNNSQTETEVPNIMTIDIDRSLSEDAGTCKIVMFNQKMQSNTTVPTAALAGESLGQPGYYWPQRGDSVTSLTKWGWATNAWNDVLQPNALIRTYQGYGGRSLAIDAALAQGYILQTGLWLVDEIEMDAATGTMTISCRDMAKLVVQQTLYPPLCPGGGTTAVDLAINGPVKYPLYYYRFVYLNHDVVPYGATVYHSGFEVLEGQDQQTDPDFSGGTPSPLVNGFSSTEYPGSPDLGHEKADAIDGDPDTYWLSNGHLSGDGPADLEFLQFELAAAHAIGGINIQPFGGNYTMYISISLDGTTFLDVGKGTIPYTPGPYTGDFGVQIPFIAKVGVGWETPTLVDITGPDNTPYDVKLFRLTFTHLANLGPTPLPYRCGVREIEIGTYSQEVTGGGRTVVAIVANKLGNPSGYWMLGSDGNVFGFGTSTRTFGSEGGDVFNAPMSGMSGHPATGQGYRLVALDGGVFDFGDCYYHGSLPGIGVALAWNTGGAAAVDIQNGGEGDTGYYILTSDGRVYAFGTATWYGNYTGNGIAANTPPTSLASTTSMAVIPGGYWITNAVGEVEAFGAAAGRVTRSPLRGSGLISAIEPTSSGNGYWLCSTEGFVTASGDAAFLGDIGGAELGGLIIDMAHANVQFGNIYLDTGYWLVGQDGGVFTYGNDIGFSGSLPEQYYEIGDGNYKDYADIINDMLLWCGWWFYTPSLGDSSPALPVFGNIEQTGIYAPDDLTEDFFDQKTVIDVINTIKEVVGYVTYADEIGAYHFQSPNIWNIGNFLDTGVPTNAMAVIDEALQITDYTVNMNDTDARSTIIIGTEDPALNVPGTQSVTITSQWGPEVLRGLIVPAMWINGQFLTAEVQTTMAHLIDLHLFLQQRQGSVTMAANPVIQIDDQVQIFERSTSETYVHYVAGYSTHMDLQTGEYNQTLTTHWMGDGDAWFLQYANPDPINEEPASGNTAPDFISENAVATGNVSIYYQSSFIASGSPPPTYSVASGAVPTGLYLNPTSGLLSGEPTADGTFTFAVTATNGSGAVTTPSVTVTISGTPVSDPPPPPSNPGSAPTLINDSPPGATEGTSYAYTFTATGSPTPTFSVSAGTLPPGLVLASNGVLSGVPTTAGTYNFAVTASNGNGSASTSLALMSTGASGGGGGTLTSGIYWGARINGAFENANYGTSTTNDAPWAAGDPELNNWTAFEDHAGKKITAVYWGGPGADGLYAFDPTGESFARSRNAFSVYNVAATVQDLIDLANNSDANGALTRAASLASSIGAISHPFMVRPWWEMNFTGLWNWNPPNITAAQYVSAWQNLYTIFNANASNISFFWCPNAIPSGFGIADPTPWFPGVNYVDWVGFDGYTHSGETTTPETLFNGIYDVCQTLAPNLPIAIGEMACSATAGGIGKTAWVTDFLNTWLPAHPAVKMFIWFNEAGSPVDPFIEEGPGSTLGGASQAAFVSGIANSYYLDNIVNGTTFPDNNKVPIPGGGMTVGGGTMSPPAFVDDTPPNGTVGTSYTYTFTAVGDPNPTFSHTGTLPNGLTLSSSGILAGIPTAAGTFGSFSILATNGDGSVSVSPVILIASSVSGNSSPPPPGGYFTLSAPGASFPGGMSVASADVAAAALVVPSTWEPRPQNNTANSTIAAQPNSLANFPELNATWNSTYLPRISGNFSGTTDEIIQWVAAKWGLSDETIRAECVTESTWVQANQGDFEPRSNNHFVFDISADPCPTSFGIIQVKWYFHPPIVSEGGTVTSSSDPTSSYPDIRLSTAYCLDIYAAMIRGIYEGMSTYLGATTGDIWGAIGSWYSGDWHSTAANSYIASVQSEVTNKRWLQTGF